MKGRIIVWMVLVILVLGGGIFFLFRRTVSTSAPVVAPLQTEFRPALPSRPASEIHREWKERVANILRVYDDTHDARVARDTLLALTVTRDDQTIHLQLVLAFQALVDGDRKTGERDLRRARDAFIRLSSS